ncbi:MAG TPA: NAD(P)/FAD-dependent oxidoreductase [Caulobacteraceae bacterium]|nr:NAD(P)/FAD-dependent oxidoreductase [Caulobacteraceae bacterium]
MSDEILDAVVIGAGPAGLTAGVYLGRYRRNFLIVDGGDPRAGWIPITRNCPGFPDGIKGTDLLARLRQQGEKYGARIISGRAERLEETTEGFIVHLEDGQLRARSVLLATGVKDNEPKLGDVFDAVQRKLIRICPICDGYETIGQSVGIVGSSEKGAREAVFMRTYSDQVTLIHVGEPQTLPEEDRLELAKAGIDVVETHIGAVHIEDDRITAFDFEDGVKRQFDVVYSALGTTPRSRLAEELGAEVDEVGSLRVNSHQMTSVDGLYAAGDLVRGLNQITVAEAEAAIAATGIHNRLRQRGL